MKFGPSHVYVTTALAAFGILALLGTVPLPGIAPVQLFAELLIAAQLIALVLRRGAANDRLIFGLTLGHFLAGTLLGGGLVFLIAFIGLATVLPAALVLSHLRREVEGNYQQGARDRTGSPVDVPRILRSRRVMGRGSLAALAALSLPLLGVTAVLFLVLPRLEVGPWSGFDAQRGRVHFNDSVDLRARGTTPDPSVALRFWVEGTAEPAPARMVMRFRGAAMEDFDGVRWSRASGRSASLPSTSTSTSTSTSAVTIEQFGFEPPAMFVPARTRALRVLETGDDGPRKYVADVATDARESVQLDGVLAPAERARDLALPDALPKRIAELAHAWADPEPTPEAKARSIEQHLKKELAYDLDSSSRGAAQPLEHFLFESKRGHCELFASSMAVMLRAVGIPSRNVTGLLGGQYNRFGGFYYVRQGQAHAWVEAYLDGPHGGWRTFDPTPSGPPLAVDTGLFASTRDLGDAVSMRWGTGIVSYDHRTQSALVDMLRRPLAIAAALVVAMFMALGFRRSWRANDGARRSGRRGLASVPGFEPDADAEDAAALYAALEAALVRHGIVRDRALPPLAYAEHLVRERHPLAEDVAALTNLYLEVRFGGRPVTREVRCDFERGVGRVAAWSRA